MQTYPVSKITGLETIKYEVWYFDENNAGKPGLTIHTKLRRTVDNYYFDFSDATFKAVPTLDHIIMLGGSVNGLYYYNLVLNSTFFVDVEYSWEVTPQNTDYPPLIEPFTFEDVTSKIKAIFDKLPSGIISNFSLGTTVSNVTVEHIFELLMSMSDGRYTIDKSTGRITFFKRDNLTPLTIVTATETSRVRNPL